MVRPFAHMDITEVFCDVDDFCKVFEPLLSGLLLPEVAGANGLKLVTRVRRNMKNQLTEMFDKQMPRHRGVIESVNDQLKHLCQIDHSRHRSVLNFMVNLVAGLIAYTYHPEKPSVLWKPELL